MTTKLIGLDNGSGITNLIYFTETNNILCNGITLTGNPDIYTKTFTNAGSTGRYGPSLTQIRSVYGVWSNDSGVFDEGAYQGYQLWTIPYDGIYKIKVYGAQGGRSGYSTNGYAYGGKGAWTEGLFVFTAGTKIQIIVGQAGSDGVYGTAPYVGGGGGGASWVLSEDLSVLYAVAGGGGGANAQNYAQGYGTDGGTTQANLADSTGGGTYGWQGSGGGAGFTSDGQNGGQNNSQGLRPANTCIGGDYGYFNVNYTQFISGVGGFGGGAGNGAEAGGGGGGYGGGVAVNYNISPGAYGGTSRNNGTNISFGTHTDPHGKVEIVKISDIIN